MNRPSLLNVRVARKAGVALDICTFELVSVDDASLPSFAAGSHIDVHLPNGLTRQYSLCNPPQESHRYVIGVLRDANSRGGSRAMHDQVREGDVLHISTPKNHFGLAHEAERHLLIAGGIGVTPILCMAERLEVIGQAFEMHYSARSIDRMAFLDRIEASSFARKVQFHFDDGPQAQRLDIPAVVSQPRADVHIYVCGPKGFMDAVLTNARAQGWPDAQLHYEFFSADVQRSNDDDRFDVQLASTGRVITVIKDQTVVQALAAAGIEVPTSCEQGVCGTCLTRVLEGVPDHRDMFLTRAEQARNDQFLPCCSRSSSPRLVLDL
jgi:vanillate O-demethylase ferredoxin subunit